MSKKDIEALREELKVLVAQRLVLREKERVLAARIAALEPTPQEHESDEKTQYVQL